MDAALGLQMTDVERSIEARRASASAARSLYGGFVTLSGGNDAATWIARPELDAGAWPLAVVVAICSGATEGGVVERRHDAFENFPFLRPLDRNRRDRLRRRAGRRRRSATSIVSAPIAEANCLAMHAVMLSARPALSYWTGATVELHGACARTARRRRTCVLHDRRRTASEGRLRTRRYCARARCDGGSLRCARGHRRRTSADLRAIVADSA